MREKYRNPIASIKKFPQFTIMNVIDGQAGLIICASLIFYSLTTDNILNIIVLLILAGISIQMLTGDNGILQRAGEAKEKTERAQIIEIAQTDILGKQAENKGTLSESELEEILTSNSYNTKGTLSDNEEESILEKTLTSSDGKYTILVSEIYNGSLITADSEETLKGPNGKPLVNKTNIPETSHDKIIGEDANGNQVVVPDGFKVADDSGATVKDGIVIEDAQGNQYVWIQVSNIKHDGSNKIKVNSSTEEGVEITLGRYTFDTDTGDVSTVEGTYQYASVSTNEPNEPPVALGATPTSTSKYYQELTTHRESNGLYNTTGTNTTAKEMGAFINSVSTNKGYYIARYEASYRENGKAGSKVSTSSADTLALTSTPATRTSGDLWNFVKQGEAATACQNLYSTIKSDLMNSYAWDTAIVYIQAMGNTNYANANRGSNTTLKNTGDTGDQKCKIFDMAGNASELTTEYSSFTYDSYALSCVDRGGYYSYSDSYTSSRHYDTAKADHQEFSFRPTLYL